MEIRTQLLKMERQQEYMDQMEERKGMCMKLIMAIQSIILIHMDMIGIGVTRQTLIRDRHILFRNPVLTRQLLLRNLIPNNLDIIQYQSNHREHQTGIR